MAGQVSASDFWAGLNSGARIAFPKLFTVEALTDDLVIDATYGNCMRLDPGGASRDVTLPAEAGADGAFYLIVNAADAAEDLVIKDDGGSTVCTVNRDEAGVVMCDGSSWHLLVMLTAPAS